MPPWMTGFRGVLSGPWHHSKHNAFSFLCPTDIPQGVLPSHITLWKTRRGCWMAWALASHIEGCGFELWWATDCFLHRRLWVDVSMNNIDTFRILSSLTFWINGVGARTRFSQCTGKVTESDIELWCLLLGLTIGPHYEVAVSARCCNEILVLVW